MAAERPSSVPLVGSAPEQLTMGTNQALNADTLMTQQEQSPAYKALHANHLITSQYRVQRTDELDVVKSNNTITASRVLCCTTCNGCCCCMSFFEVSKGCVRKGHHSNGEYLLFGEGVHTIKSPYVSVERRDIPLLSNPNIVHGTRAILTVEQGFVGLATDRGQPVLLAPGMHQWNSTTMKFENMIDLSTSVIRMGPYTLITVDEGYAGVTSDNGEQKVLEGGRAYMLTHRNWKFEKFMTKKLQTNDVGPMKVTTGDNVPLEAIATVNWLIEDAKLAARMAANTMADNSSRVPNQTATGEFDISKLRQDVLRQVSAALASFIGSVSYTAHGHETAAARKEGDRKREAGLEMDAGEGRRALFDPERLAGSVDIANNICSRYGVKILSINLISASPSDRGLLDALSQGAVASVAAEQTETAARGDAQATLLKAKAEAEAARIRAEGEARAEELRAEGSLKAAQRLESSEVAVALAKMKTAGACLKDGKANSFFFGLQGAGDIPSGMLGTAALANVVAANGEKR